MFSTYPILILICYFPLISSTLITVYKNAQFDPFDNHSIIYNLSSIESQNVCICQCFMNPMCKTITYNGYYQYCILYLAYLQEGKFQIMTTDANSSVCSLRNITYSDPVISSVGTTKDTTTQVISQPGTTAIETSSSHILSTMVTTVTTTSATTNVATCTTWITFDDIPGQLFSYSIIPNGYKNLNWTNAGYIYAPGTLPNSGYRYGVRSPPFVMYNPVDGNVPITTANGTHFSFDSLYLTSAWRDYLNVTLKTIRGSSITSTSVYTVMTSYASYISCNICTNIDTIILQAGGGILHANFTANGTQFVVDNLCISFGH